MGKGSALETAPKKQTKKTRQGGEIPPESGRTRNQNQMKRKFKQTSILLALKSGGTVPVTGWEFDFGGATVVAHRTPVEISVAETGKWQISHKATGWGCGVYGRETRAGAVALMENTHREVAFLSRVRAQVQLLQPATLNQ